MKITTVMKPAMLFAAGSAASVASAAPTIEYNATPEGTQITLAGSSSPQYLYSSRVKTDFPDPSISVNEFYLTGQDGATVSDRAYFSSEDAMGSPRRNFVNETKTGSDIGLISTLAASDNYYGLRFAADGKDYVGYAGVINNGATINDIGFQLAAGVPEPATWALMIAGFGGAGMAMRRRRRQSGVVAPLAAVA